MGCFEHLVESGADICDGLRWPSGTPVWKRPRGLLGQRVVSSPLIPDLTPASPHPLFMAGVSLPEDRAPLTSPFPSPCPLRHPLPSLGFSWAIICPPRGRGAQACVRVTHPHPPTAGPPLPTALYHHLLVPLRSLKILSLPSKFLLLLSLCIFPL